MISEATQKPFQPAIALNILPSTRRRLPTPRNAKYAVILQTLETSWDNRRRPMKGLLQTMLQEVLEAETETALQAGKSERTSCRQGYRSGHYPRTLVTRVGKLELRVPQDRRGRFSTELFARYQRSEKALVAALMEMNVQGVSTRRVKTITEELCGHEFSTCAISALNVKMDEELRHFMQCRLEEPYPYIILDARYERVRETGVGQSRAVLITLGIGWDGRRHVLAVELAGRESTRSWKEHLLRLQERGLHGVQLAVSDDHAGLKRAIMEALPEAYWQRCCHTNVCVHSAQAHRQTLPHNRSTARAPL